jgi:hypothetical protein
MMLIATGLAAAVLAAASLLPDPVEIPADSRSSAPPAMVVSVFSAPGVPPALVSRLLAEASAIWRPNGFEFVWQRVLPEVLPYARVTEPGPRQPSTLRVVIGDQRGESRDNKTPLGWIVFDDEHEPQPEIYVSYSNAGSLLISAHAVVGVIERMPPLQREILAARAMGRALAHELGHYLLASKVHTERGLLKASRTATELFSIERTGFKVDAVQRQQIATRMRGDGQVVRR